MHPFISILVLFLIAFPAKASIAPSHLKQHIQDAAKRAYIEPELLEAVIKVESNFNETATSHKGAMGLMQVMPRTADHCGIKHAYHALNNLMGASRCLRKLINRYNSDLTLALAAYNAGPTAVKRYKGVPPYPETQKYVKKVLKIYHSLKKK